MSEKFTKGPWRIGAPPPNGEQTIGTNQGLMVAVATTGSGIQTRANARRIVACVNALEHISTEDLESGRMQNLGVRLANAEKQRDELIRAIECAFREGFSASSTYNDILVNDVNEEWEKSDARAAILKATGEPQ